MKRDFGEKLLQQCGSFSEVEKKKIVTIQKNIYIKKITAVKSTHV